MVIIKSTDMKQTPETRKNFEDGWDAIFNKGAFDEAIKNSHGCSPDFLKEDSGTIKESLTVAMGEVLAHVKGEIELPSRVYHTDAHNRATEYHPDGHRGFLELKKSMKTMKSILANSEPAKPEPVKTFERIMTEVLGARFIDCPADATHEDSDS